MRDHCPKCRRDGQARYTYTNKTPLRVAAMIILVYVYLFRHFLFFYFHCFLQSTNKFLFFSFCYSSPSSKSAFHPLMVSLKRQLKGRRS